VLPTALPFLLMSSREVLKGGYGPIPLKKSAFAEFEDFGNQTSKPTH
jgi:hypothetical protein